MQLLHTDGPEKDEDVDIEAVDYEAMDDEDMDDKTKDDVEPAVNDAKPKALSFPRRRRISRRRSKDTKAEPEQNTGIYTYCNTCS